MGTGDFDIRLDIDRFLGKIFGFEAIPLNVHVALCNEVVEFLETRRHGVPLVIEALMALFLSRHHDPEFAHLGVQLGFDASVGFEQSLEFGLSGSEFLLIGSDAGLIGFQGLEFVDRFVVSGLDIAHFPTEILMFSRRFLQFPFQQ